MSKKKKIWIGVGVIAIIAVMAVIFIVKGRASTVDVESPEEMEILVQKVAEEKLEETILVTGKIVPEDEQKIYAEPENGDIKEFKVKENDKVKAGDPLFVYDASTIQREMNAAVRARDLAQNNVLAAQNQINQVTKQIDQMKKQKNQQGSQPQEGDEVGDTAFVSDEDIRQLEIDKNQQVLELENLKAEVTAAQGEINEIDERKKALTVRSKMDGVVVKINKHQERTEEGMNEPIVHIISAAPFKVIGTMSEFDAVKIKPKQKVVIKPKVYKDRDWKGSVESVSQFPTEDGAGDMDMYGGGDSNVTMYPFKVNITDDTKDLRQGFHVSLEVNVGGDEKKTVVPHMALMDDMMMSMDEEEDVGMMDEMFGEGDFMEDATQFVFVLVDGVLERRDIEIGKMSDEFVEVVEGVEVGELVVITPTPEMYDGMEVTSYDEVE